MRTVMRPTLIAAFLMISGSAFGTEVYVGINIGPPPPPYVVYAPPPCPGPDYMWVDGYWYPVKKHYKWHEGYWTRPPYKKAKWVCPRHDGRQYYYGYWEGDQGRVGHKHDWDRKHERDDYKNHHRHHNGDDD